MGIMYLININYEEEYNCNIKNSISIDQGMRNLMTIYNPTGKQKMSFIIERYLYYNH